MFRSIFKFELGYQLRQPLFWICALLFALLPFGAVTSDNVTIGGSIGNVNRNAPLVIIQLLAYMSAVGVFAVTAFVARSIHRDFEHNTSELFFSRPISKFDYFAGRFAASLLISFAALLFSALGMLIGSFMPWIDAERIGPLTLAPYIYGLGLLVLPNLLFAGAVFYTLAALSRSMLVTYLGVVIFFVGFSIAGVFLSDLESETVGALVDPFGVSAIELGTKYWTIVEQNGALPPFWGALLFNRLLWSSVALAVFAAGYVRFSYTRRLRGRKARSEADVGRIHAPGIGVDDLAVPRRFGRATQLKQLARLIRFEVVAVFKGVPFLVILAFGILNVIASAGLSQRMFGTPVFPVTHLMVANIQGSYLFLLIIIVTFYAGEIVWRERSLRTHEVSDALPVPDWIPLSAKSVAMVLVTAAFLAGGVAGTIGFQLYKGYTNLELDVYAKGMLMNGYPFILIAFLALFLQVLSKNKFIGYLIMILFLVARLTLDMVGYQHRLYKFADAPTGIYSDMNGYGHWVTPAFWFNLYWTLLTVALVLAAVLLWQRGTDTGWRQRLTLLRRRYTVRIGASIAVVLIAFMGTGAWIYYNTNIVNEYVSRDEARKRQADYEKQYRHYKDMSQPRITKVYAEVDIFPERRYVEVRGRYTLYNRDEAPIAELHLDISPVVTINSLEFGEHAIKLEDEVLGYYIYELADPLDPGEEREFSFDLAVENRGFVNHGSNTAVVHNGTFFHNEDYFPSIGYNEQRQLVDRNHRRKYGLEPVRRMANIDDELARRNNYISTDADWIDFETVVSTSAGQIAIAPGYLQREWQEGDRRYFHYKMDAPILNLFAYLSADYEVHRSQWRDVAIEIYYHRGHEYNVERMVDAIKASLDYCTAHFSPYQHRQMRIIEFPRYESFAQSLPNTVPFSESIGFIANLEDDEEDIDYVFYVTAHEVAHQWWAHQVMGGNVQGSTMIVETMAQYSALMVMEEAYGRERMRKFLKYELDNYLRNRGGELIEELPLLLVENQQYIHYRKGSVIMYGLRDYIGEGALNAAIADYIDEVAFEGAPWTTSLEMFDHFRRATPDSLAGVLEDMFESITLFENRVTEATYTETSDGRYRVSLECAARKVRADGQGVETEVGIDDWIDIGVFGDDEKTLYLEKHRVSGPQLGIELMVDELPVRAGIDPYNKLVDRNSDDNVRRVDRSEAPRPTPVPGDQAADITAL